MVFFLAVLLAASPLVIHEMGHWAVLRRLGVPVDQVWIGLGPMIAKWRGLRIGMLPIGGAVVPRPEAYQALAPGQRMAVALAGPAASLLYGVLLFAVAEWTRAGGTWKSLELIAGLNFWLAALNLIPVPPLDGFQALCAWYERKGEPLSAPLLSFASRLGNGFVYGIGFFVLARAFFPG
jgi:membrane-associated protease RseP (regulator of RpoE activity)